MSVQYSWAGFHVPGQTYRRRRTIAIITIIRVLPHLTRDLLQQHRALNPHLEHRPFNPDLLHPQSIIILLDLVDAPFELDAFSVVGCFDAGGERRVGGYAFGDAICGGKC